MINNFTHQYPLQKTLRFELKPVGKTLENIEANGLIQEDEQRAEDYKRLKEIIDLYHKDFISEALSSVALEGIEEYERLFFDANRDEKPFEKLQETMRKQIRKAFEKHPNWKYLFKKELITKVLPDWQHQEITESDREIIDKFKKFTTYLTGFHENRKNIYSDEAKHTAIAYRVVHENLPVYLQNKRLFEQIKERYPDIIKSAKEELDGQDKLLGATVEEVFQLEYYPYLMNQIHIDIYNTVLGGFALDDGTKMQGINEKINLYRQKIDLTKRDLPNMKPLYKQILSDKEALSWLPESFETTQDLYEALASYYDTYILHFVCCDGEVNLLEKFGELFEQSEEYDLNRVYIKNDRSLTDISQAIFGDFATIKNALWQHFLKENPRIANATDIDEKKEKFFDKKKSYFSIKQIEDALKEYGFEVDIFEYFNKFGTYKNSEKKDLREEIKGAYKEWISDRENKEKIKALLQSLLNLQHFLKPLYVKDEIEKDIAFYAYFDIYYEALSLITPLFNKARNFLTKKPYSTEKFKLNFQNSTLLDGWDVNKEIDNSALLFERDGLYYLGIMDKKHNRIFQDIEEDTVSEKVYCKIEYKLLPGANKMLPKVFFSKSRIDEFAPSPHIVQKYKEGTHKKGEKFNLNDCHNLIDFFKSSIGKHPDWKQFDFKFSPTDTYKDLSDFYKEVEHQGYKISFKNISTDTINKMVDEGKLYLFQIYNKDFSPYSKGTPNLHTIYWRMVFNEHNLRDVIYKLNGQAEVFYRKRSIEYSKKIWREGHHAKELAEKFDYPIIKDRRFALDKFQFHVPVTLNFKAQKTGSKEHNLSVREEIKGDGSDIKIIGIDRGERHLLYLSLIDNNGSIVEQYSLNTIVNSYNGKEHKVDYHQKLDKKEEERRQARLNWESIEKIKELKEGYMSHVIHKIATLIVEHNAIVVLEDLNFGFKRGRFKVEKQVYQKFEKMLIDKLNYLVDKKKAPHEIGGALKALQLTNKFESFEKMGKQNGILFYVPAWNTSKIDPTTGFVNLFDTRYYSREKSREFFDRFKEIEYNAKEDYFEFSFDYNRFHRKAEGTRTEWTLCSYGDRIRSFRNPEKSHQWDDELIDLTEEFKILFNGQTQNLKAYILLQDDAEFFKTLHRLFKLMLQMRNSSAKMGEDYLISPVRNSDGYFYDSRKSDGSLPLDADANGAYNIARKGLMLVRKIAQADDVCKVDLKITNKEWMRFAQGVER